MHQYATCSIWLGRLSSHNVFSDNLHRNCTTYYIHVILAVKFPCMEFSDWNVTSRAKSCTRQLHASIKRKHVLHHSQNVCFLARTRVNDFSPWSLTVHSKEHLAHQLKHLSRWSYTTEMFVNLVFAGKKCVGFHDRINISSTREAVYKNTVRFR